MELVLNRFISDDESTLGVLWVNKERFCFTLEDEQRTIKVPGETRIPAGRYQIKYRKVDSTKTLQYRKKFPDFFTWHLELQGVPNFEFVYIHIGNTDKDSDGCILVGKTYQINTGKPDTIGKSTEAFVALYKKVSSALDAEEEVWLTITDEEK